MVSLMQYVRNRILDTCSTDTSTHFWRHLCSAEEEALLTNIAVEHRSSLYYGVLANVHRSYIHWTSSLRGTWKHTTWSICFSFVGAKYPMTPLNITLSIWVFLWYVWDSALLHHVSFFHLWQFNGDNLRFSDTYDILVPLVCRAGYNCFCNYKLGCNCKTFLFINSLRTSCTYIDR